MPRPPSHADPARAAQHARLAAEAVVRTLRNAGHAAYFAGGCVRDELLGLAPTDYDVATDATPNRLTALFPRANLVGAAFGVVLVKPDLPANLKHADTPTPVIPTPVIEVATFRSDGVYTDKRRPDTVTFADARADAARRDFTINALFLDPTPTTENPRGTIIDYVDGQADLAARVLRAVGDPHARLAEDHLRALRAARFAARLNLAIDPTTRDAIRQHAAELSGVSRERIGDELRRMLEHPTRAVAAQLMQSLGLDAPALGEATKVVSTPTLAALPQETTAMTALAAWLIDRGQPIATVPSDPRRLAPRISALRKNLTLSNDETDALAGSLESLAVISATGPWETMTIAGQKRAAVRPGFDAACTLLAAIDPARHACIIARVEHLAQTAAGLAPPPVLTGDDLVAAGWKPGKRFKEVLDLIYDAQLEGRLTTRDQALAKAEQLGR